LTIDHTLAQANQCVNSPDPYVIDVGAVFAILNDDGTFEKGGELRLAREHGLKSW